MSRIVIFFVMVLIRTSSARPGWSQSKEGEVEEPVPPPSDDCRPLGTFCKRETSDGVVREKRCCSGSCVYHNSHYGTKFYKCESNQTSK
ncbi:Hypothetical predicted protein [Paramuricea clavata]|nr:Hypothetical predicted protein [Paramuricea clavata]